MVVSHLVYTPNLIPEDGGDVMAGSLQDQLIKAGLATPQQAKKAEREKRAQQQQGKKFCT